jgi:hypothetical protein
MVNSKQVDSKLHKPRGRMSGQNGHSAPRQLRTRRPAGVPLHRGAGKRRERRISRGCCKGSRQQRQNAPIASELPDQLKGGITLHLCESRLHRRGSLGNSVPRGITSVSHRCEQAGENSNAEQDGDQARLSTDNGLLSNSCFACPEFLLSNRHSFQHCLDRLCGNISWNITYRGTVIIIMWLVGWLVGWLMQSSYSYAGGDRSHKNGASTP